MLSPFRVLDLTDDKGFLCGKILGDLGADVIKIERPGGDASRNLGPFYHDIPDPEKSLYWFAYNANKRGITLNIETTDGQEIFMQLVNTAHFIIESFPPGYMDRLGLGFSNLSAINSGIIMTSITPFGQSGPYRDYKSSDLVSLALGGHLYLNGDPDRPPTRCSHSQACLLAGARAAGGSLIAHYYREMTGAGQFVDVSIQASVTYAMLNAQPFWSHTHTNLRRVGPYRTGATLLKTKQLQTWPCKDGYVAFGLFGGPGQPAHTNRSLSEWMDSEGMSDDFLRNMNWDEFDMAKVTVEEYDHIANLITKFFNTHTKNDLFEGAVKRRMMLSIVSTPRDVAKNIQLRAREFWQEVEHPELGASIKYPGHSTKASEVPLTIKRRAPLIGEHNNEIYEQELNISEEKLLILKQSGVI